MKNEKNITPVLLGGDLNAYSVALAFREAFGVTSHAFVRYRCGATENSKFIKTHVCSGIDNVSVALPELLNFAKEHSDGELFLIPCSDSYVEMLERARVSLSESYSFCLPDLRHFKLFSDKCGFAQTVRRFGIAHPEYVSFEKGEIITYEKLIKIPHPAVVKPSSSTEYFKHPFPSMKKVYFTSTEEESENVIEKIFSSGYSKSVILQKRIGTDNKNRVLTTFSDRSGRVVMAALGDVILEEVGKTSFGNHSAIITAPINKTAKKIIRFLNKIEYRGFANFDIMQDGNEEFVLEMNLRQGRSCDYLRGAGINIAELIVKDCRGEKINPEFSEKEIYWHYPPNKTVMSFASLENARRAESLVREGDEYTPYNNIHEGIIRGVYAKIHNFRLGRTIGRDFAARGADEAF